MKAVFLVPYRPDGGRRDELWAFTRAWLQKNHPNWEIFEGASPDGPFSRGAAVNDAARRARDWDVAVVHDGDNIADPATLKRAVSHAYKTGGCAFPFDTYFYLDRYTTDRLMIKDNWFISPVKRNWGVMRRHHSGVQAISRAAFDAVGGFVELEGWGYEDSIMAQLLKCFTGDPKYLRGGAYHLFHATSTRAREPYASINYDILCDVMALSVVPDQLREFLRSGGHPIP